MSFGKRLSEVGKSMGLSQEEVAKHLGTKAPVIGRYERDEMKPSIETATKLADLLEVSLDYLVGKTDVEVDRQLLKRVLEVQQMEEEDREHILYTLDALIKNVKLKSIA
ncbi:helix-turn-helix domain-containing protein [Flagellimonas hadalis]|uniref:Helix-turn-helix transcriptional regulator n=1 Tax=Flagellimonas hadalis TaxID=2597517 RepID=A0A5N5IN93_9FLAO|nr:helix-turn-helix transcriptional regulator [Allomuricauda hadalis]KAB5483642.1 helix-turn-helix transcriptional regulator [Allomuricauda hadalis]